MDSRTKELHESTYQEYQGSQSPIWPDIQQLEIGEGSASARRPLEPIEHDSDDEPIEQDSDDEPIEQDSDDDHQIEQNEQNSDDDDYYIDDAFLFRRRTKRYTTHLKISGGGDSDMVMIVMMMTIQMKIKLLNILNLPINHH